MSIISWVARKLGYEPMRRYTEAVIGAFCEGGDYMENGIGFTIRSTTPLAIKVRRFVITYHDDGSAHLSAEVSGLPQQHCHPTLFISNGDLDLESRLALRDWTAEWQK